MRTLAGARLALSWLTILPARVGQVDTGTARAAIRWAPLVGALLGVAASGVGFGSARAGAPTLLTGLLLVALLALLTRGMHLDGLADTVDGFGCYGPPERALSVMRDGSTGPFAVAALVVLLGAQAVALGSLAGTGRWTMIVVALAVGRAAFGWCARRGVPAARQEGLGALVAGSQHPVVPVAWGLVLAAGAAFVPGLPYWQGPVAVAVAAALVVLLVWHARRRFGGISGDVLGAASELASTAVLVVATFRA